MSAPKALVAAVSLLATVVTVIALIPLAIDALGLGLHAVANPDEPADVNRTVQLGADYVANEVIEWWVDLVVGIAKVSPLLAVGFILVLKWTGRLDGV